MRTTLPGAVHSRPVSSEDPYNEVISVLCAYARSRLPPASPVVVEDSPPRHSPATEPESPHVQLFDARLTQLERQLQTSVAELRDMVATLMRTRDTPPSDTRLVAVAPERPIVPLSDSRSLLPRELQAAFPQFHGRTWSLIYSGKAHGFGAADFHDHCDGKANTITIVRTKQGRVFGGFTPVRWESTTGVYKRDTDRLESFLFRVTTDGTEMVKRYPITNKQCAIYCKWNYGPTFGSEHDLHICDNCNEAEGSYTVCGTSYSGGGSENDIYFNGTRNFKVEEIQVFEILA
jgi:hypothetical protein